MVFTCSYANIGTVKMYVCVCNTLHGYDLASSRVIITWIPCTELYSNNFIKWLGGFL